MGSVAELWRYPVKSMLGEPREELVVTPQGALGDRAWALREIAGGRIASAKRFPRLLEFRARYVSEPTFESPGRVRIEAPGGRELDPEDPDAAAIVSELLGRPLRFENVAGPDEKAGIDRETVFGDVPVGAMKPEWTPESMPDYFQLKAGSFLEIGALFLVTSGSIEHLRQLQGGTAIVDRRRFRPNVYVDTGGAPGEFVEDGWLGRTLAIGAGVRLDEFKPTLWCVTSTLAQEELPRDLSILRTAAEHHRGCLGVYGSVRAPGTLRAGDEVLLD